MNNLQNLTVFLGESRRNSDILAFDEAKIKQKVILPILHHLGWDVFNDVEPEFSVKGGRVDYALKVFDSYKVFIEAKKPNEDPSRHQEQLLDYSFKAGVELSVLTNGVTWLFFLPLKSGSWEQRKFYTIDIREQDPEEAAKRFGSFLSKELITSGQAIKNAEAILEDQRKESTIKKTLPVAWEKLISSGDEYLLDLLSGHVEKLCGYRPDYETVEEFLTKYQSQRFEPNPPTQRFESVKPIERKKTEALSTDENDLFNKKPSSFSFDGRRYQVSKWRDILINLCNILYQKSPSQFQELLGWRGSRRYYFHSDPTQMDLPERIAVTPSPIYVETKWSGRDTVRFCRRIIERLGYKQTDIEVEYY